MSTVVVTESEEAWRAIPDAPDYEASSLGRIRSLKFTRPRVLAQRPNERGYATVSLVIRGRQRDRSVHVLVASAFYGIRRKKAVVNHRDLDRMNNRVENLEVVSASCNALHYQLAVWIDEVEPELQTGEARMLLVSLRQRFFGKLPPGRITPQGRSERMGRKPTWPPQPHSHKASGQERVCIKGKHYYLGKIGSLQAKERYVELIKKCEESGMGKAPEPPPRRGNVMLTVAEVIERHRADAQRRYSESGREAAQFRYAVAPLLDVYPAVPARKVDVNLLEEVRDEMIKRGWDRKVINRRVIRIRTVWRWAERRGLVPAGSWAALRALEPLPSNDRRASSAPPRQAPPWSDFARACRHCPPTVRAMLLVQLFGGMRSQDVRTMRVRELERPKEGEWIYRPPAHKNAWRGHERAVVLGPRARKVIAPFLEGRKPSDYVFPSGPGRCYTDEAYPRALARACERAGVTPFPPSSLRHLARQRATRAGGLEEARAMLGHASVTTSAHQYAAGTDLELARRAARRVG